MKYREPDACLSAIDKNTSTIYKMLPLTKEITVNIEKSVRDNFPGFISDIIDVQFLMAEEKLFKMLSKMIVDNKTMFVPEEIKNDLWQGQFTKARYKMSGVIFEIHYYSSEIKDVIHPKFFYLEVDSEQEVDCNLDVCYCNGFFSLQVDGKYVGSWINVIFFSEMLSMIILEKIYKQEENKWMGIFHAASISNYKKCLIIAGEEGSGKSTLSAILSTLGYDVLADDFLPIESETGMACRFPTTISLKNEVVNLLQLELPELKTAKEFYDNHKKEKIRYFPVKNPAFFEKPDNVTCEAIVFVKYVSGSRISILNVNEEVAFEKFMSEALIYLLEENVVQFLRWFKNLKYYELTYSDSQEMVEGIAKLFEKG